MRFEPTDNQRDFIGSILDNRNHLCVCNGPAGSGKTLIALMTAIGQLKQNAIDQIIISRTIVGVGNELGSLPGNLKERCDPYFMHVYDYLKVMLDKDYGKFMKDEKIKILPLEIIRGHTYDHAYIILDEAQNASVMQTKTFISRLGKQSKAIIIGDKTQKDIPEQADGLTFCLLNLPGVKGCSIDELDYTDIKRNDRIQHILRVFDENRP